jgi:allophanate hydrolase subunit 2
MLTTVQDLGRTGYQGLGVPVSGPMDAYSHRLANQLLGNHPMAAALEITLLGPELVAEGEMTCAIAGGEIEMILDGGVVPRHQPFRVPSGARIPVRHARTRDAAHAGRPGRVRRSGHAWQPVDSSRQPHGTLRRSCASNW